MKNVKLTSVEFNKLREDELKKIKGGKKTTVCMCACNACCGCTCNCFLGIGSDNNINNTVENGWSNLSGGSGNET